VLNASEEALRRRPVRCAIYTRQSVSSSDSLSSFDVQYEACGLYLESQREHGWTLLPDRFDDDGYSGASLDRPALNRLLALIRRGEVDQILVHRLDRLSRSVRDCVTLLDEFRRLEVGLVIVTAPELGHSAQDNFMLNILASFAEFEREIIAARIADSRAQLKERHLRFAGAVPLGYDSDRRTKKLVPNLMEAEIVRWMFAEAASGKRPAEIATNANARRFRTKANGPWSARQVVATLRNPVYVGRFKDGKSVRPACHEPIIDMSLFEAVGRALDSRWTARPKRTICGAVWLLKGKIYCRRCGRLLTSHSCRHGVIVYRYYRCRATSGGRPPRGYQVPAGRLEAEVHLHFPWPVRRDMRSGQFRDAVERIESDPDTDAIVVLWRKTEA
jgi:DNA invertase Pin-like site-specific DNA recombinase